MIENAADHIDRTSDDQLSTYPFTTKRKKLIEDLIKSLKQFSHVSLVLPTTQKQKEKAEIKRADDKKQQGAKKSKKNDAWCGCGEEKEGKLWIECKDGQACNGWVHGDCADQTKASAEKLSQDWVCPFCSKQPASEKKQDENDDAVMVPPDADAVAQTLTRLQAPRSKCIAWRSVRNQPCIACEDVMESVYLGIDLADDFDRDGDFVLVCNMECMHVTVQAVKELKLILREEKQQQDVIMEEQDNMTECMNEALLSFEHADEPVSETEKKTDDELAIVPKKKATDDELDIAAMMQAGLTEPKRKRGPALTDGDHTQGPRKSARTASARTASVRTASTWKASARKPSAKIAQKRGSSKRQPLSCLSAAAANARAGDSCGEAAQLLLNVSGFSRS